MLPLACTDGREHSTARENTHDGLAPFHTSSAALRPAWCSAAARESKRAK